MRIILVSIFIFFLSSPSTDAQELRDSLRPIEVKAKKIKATDDRQELFAPAVRSDTISLDRDIENLQSLAEIIALKLPVYIHSFGVNGNATLTLRGASAQQTQVLWNGVPLNNAASGVSDISLLPAGIFHHVAINYSNNSSMWGSGNVGGALVLLDEAPQFEKSLKAQSNIGVGDFGHRATSAGVVIANEHLQAYTQVFARGVNNNFELTNRTGKKEKQQHAHLQSSGFVSGLAVKLGSRRRVKSLLETKVWWQKTKREIPKALFENISKKNRSDAQLRSLIAWSQETIHAQKFLKVAFFDEQAQYTDEAIGLRSKYRTQTFFADGGFGKIVLNDNWHTTVFLPVQLSKLFKEQKVLLGSQTKLALVNAWSWQSRGKKWKVAAHNRLEYASDKINWLPSIQTHFLSNNNEAGAQLQKTYRLPTLNELYYSPGGNINLKPERGWSVDGWHRLHGLTPNRKWVWTHEVALYSRVIKDWVMWYGGAIWTPHNLAKVWSRGGEWQLMSKRLFKNGFAQLGHELAFNKATSLQSYIPNDNSMGSQIPNVPVWKELLYFEVQWAGWRANVNTQWVSRRFITIDQSQHVPSYRLWGLAFNKQWTGAGYQIQWGVQLNNLLNTSYEVVQGRPMPGRHILASCTLGNP